MNLGAPNNSARREAGFTLVEVLTVLVIIGLLSGFVVLNMPQPKAAIISQAETLSVQTNRAAQLGIVNGDSYALGLSSEGYAVLLYADEAWSEPAITAWEQISVSAQIEGQPIELGEDIVPLIIFEPSGLSTPFTLELKAHPITRTITSIGDGRVQIEEEL